MEMMEIARRYLEITDFKKRRKSWNPCDCDMCELETRMAATLEQYDRGVN